MFFGMKFKFLTIYNTFSELCNYNCQFVCYKTQSKVCVLKVIKVVKCFTQLMISHLRGRNVVDDRRFTIFAVGDNRETCKFVGY